MKYLCTFLSPRYIYCIPRFQMRSLSFWVRDQKAKVVYMYVQIFELHSCQSICVAWITTVLKVEAAVFSLLSHSEWFYISLWTRLQHVSHNSTLCNAKAKNVYNALSSTPCGMVLRHTNNFWHSNLYLWRRKTEKNK